MSITCSLCRRTVQASIILCSQEEHDVCIKCYDRSPSCRKCTLVEERSSESSGDQIYREALSLSQYIRDTCPQSVRKNTLVEKYSDTYTEDELCTLLNECIYQGWLYQNGDLYHHISN